MSSVFYRVAHGCGFRLAMELFTFLFTILLELFYRLTIN